VLGSPSFSASDLMVLGVDLARVFWLVVTLCERGECCCYECRGV
jgi:hypothetical protein